MTTSTVSARLRVVGQELEQRRISDFEVRVEQDGYRVRGQVPAPPAAAPALVPKRKLGDFFKPKSTAVALEPSPEPGEWEQSYTWPEIERLDEGYKARRAASGAPDEYAVSQVLRVVGAFVEQHSWDLVGVSRKRQVIEIRHLDADGRVQTSEQKYSALYDFALHLFRTRRADGT